MLKLKTNLFLWLIHQDTWTQQRQGLYEQGIHLRPETGRIVWSFLIPRPVLSYQYLGVFPALPEKRWKRRF